MNSDSGSKSHGPLTDLARCRILISNDDGIAAHGLAVLERIALALSDDVWVVAPALERSGAGHSLTIHEPLRPVKLGERRYSVSGTPTDCVMVAVNHILRDQPPDLVLSGINHGPNLGEDVHYSGTVAAAMEGTLLGVRAIALSQAFSQLSKAPWQTAEHYGPNLIREICALPWGRDVLININFPDCAVDAVRGVKPSRQGRHKTGEDFVLRHDPRGRPYLWIGEQRYVDRSSEGDLKAVDDGYIAVTPLNVDLTHQATLNALMKRYPQA
jgi:5'-nucleotidase